MYIYKTKQIDCNLRGNTSKYETAKCKVWVKISELRTFVLYTNVCKYYILRI